MKTFLERFNESKILKGSVVLFVGTLLFKAIFLYKDILLTSKLGLSFELTLFVTAFFIPAFLSNNLGLSLQIYISSITQLQNKSLSNNQLFHSLLKVSVLNFGIYAAISLFIPFLFDGFTGPQISSLQFLFWLSFIYSTIIPIRTMLGQLLYLNRWFVLNFSLAFVVPVSLVIAILSFKEITALKLMIVLNVATIIETLVVYFVCNFKNLISKTLSLESSLGFSVLIQGFILQFLISSSPVLDQLFAHHATPDFLTIFNYANKVPNIISTISMVISSSVLLPFFLDNKQMSFNNSKLKSKFLISIFGLVVLYILIPYISPLIVGIIYHNGKFSTEAALQVSQIQSLYLYSAPLTAIYLVFIRYLNAHEKHSLALGMASMVLVLNLVFNFFWHSIGKYELLPLSVIGSYIITTLIFLILIKAKMIRWQSL